LVDGKLRTRKRRAIPALTNWGPFAPERGIGVGEEEESAGEVGQARRLRVLP